MTWYFWNHPPGLILCCEFFRVVRIGTLSSGRFEFVILISASDDLQRVMLRDASGAITGSISDRHVVSWFAEHVCPFLLYSSTSVLWVGCTLLGQAAEHSHMEDVLALPLSQLDIGINKRVISLPSKASVLDAMKLMHEQGVSSIAVIDTEGSLLSVCAKLSSMVQMRFVSNRVPQAVSVTDIGRLVATSPDRSVLSVSLAHFISLIKASCTSELRHARSHIRCSSHRDPQTAKIDIPCIVSLNRHNLAMLFSCCWQVCATILPFCCSCTLTDLSARSQLAPPIYNLHAPHYEFKCISGNVSSSATFGGPCNGRSGFGNSFLIVSATDSPFHPFC